MQLFIRGAELSVMSVDECLTVDELKHQIADLEGIPFEDQVLSFGGKPLEGESTLIDCGVHDSFTLDVVGRVLGGIVDKKMKGFKYVSQEVIVNDHFYVRHLFTFTELPFSGWIID